MTPPDRPASADAPPLTASALVVDDDPDVRQSLRLCLEADNTRVQHVATSAGALAALDRSRFDVVFLDLWLGAESGLVVLSELLRRQPDIGVIVVMAYASRKRPSRPCGSGRWTACPSRLPRSRFAPPPGGW